VTVVSNISKDEAMDYESLGGQGTRNKAWWEKPVKRKCRELGLGSKHTVAYKDLINIR
jgi:hypothetical protein